MENARSDPPPPSQDSASLLKRLAGPSSGKAGLAKDQTEINRIIAEASKGSKFYEVRTLVPLLRPSGRRLTIHTRRMRSGRTSS